MLKKTFALSAKGARDVFWAIILTALHNLSVMLPTVLLLMLVAEMLGRFLGTQARDLSLLFYWSTALLLLLVIYWVYRFTYRKTYVSAYEESANTRITLAEQIRKLPLSYFGSKDLSDLTSTLMDDTATVEHTLATSVAELFGGIISSAVILLTLFFFDWRMGLALFICLPVSMLILLLSRRLSSSSNWKNRRAKLSVSEGLQEYLENMKVVQSSPQKETYRLGLEDRIRKVVRTSMIYELVMGVFISGAYNTLRVGLGLVIVTGSYLIIHGEISLITYLLFLFVAARVYDPFTTLFFKMGEFFYSLVSASRIREVCDFPVQQGEPEVRLDTYDITFEHVSFAYNEENVINDVSFTARQGEITALVGPSGCGKSTLSKLAARFWDVNCGRILIGGRDIGSIEPETLLSYVSIVFQDVVLFNDTIYNNIKIGKKDATRAEIMAAARTARCEEFIQKLPQGYDTVIGENGKTLSGGERQRLSIARALLKNAPIILLDEATASLDPENETLIQEAIGKLIKDKTVLIIAHRLRSVENCDQIIVLREGRIAETGRHRELMDLNGLYRHLVELQRASAAWEVGAVRQV
ncbi:ABC transporter ATP-binding protein [Desulfitobacterium chlororespirans]|uniref:ATP-binding cassette, subfamily B n=1 Tax=Desulfitobacterium chlororespirans DSM 11544 TaxID=1121395 RepID=A0A1M7TII2_9FIRM|nr:ABC transporter ATP-binding protein [Desulfitobacterium chlororespirans]SHN70491.1 ATP-binding cassette, subfamily B [Desulfitobacterium chlororespirans DSM 11544]